ncbi:2-oxoglutarate ferredoxin oxidoreductase subunit alpha, partial [Streptomyces pseudogriseolus]
MTRLARARGPATTGADTLMSVETIAPAVAGAVDKEVRRLDRVIIRFAGDSGDGMQLTGDRFTSETASFGNDLS